MPHWYSHGVWESLSGTELLGIVEHQSELQALAGFLWLQPEYVDSSASRTAAVVYLDVEHREALDLLPPDIAGMPVVVKLRDCASDRVVEIQELG